MLPAADSADDPATTAEDEPIPETEPAKVHEPIKVTESAEKEPPVEHDRPTAAAEPEPEAKAGGLGRWRHLLHGRTSRPTVQPTQAPARDVEISTSETPPPPPDEVDTSSGAAALAGTEPIETAADTSSFARPKATPLKRRSRAAEPAKGAIATTSAEDTNDTAAIDQAANKESPGDETATVADSEATPLGAPATLQPTDAHPHAPVLPSRSGGPADANPSPAVGTAGPQGPDSPPPMWQEPQRLPMDKKTKNSLLIAGIAGALLAVLAIGFAVFSVTTNEEVAGPSAGPSVTASTTPKPAALADELMLDDADAQLIDPESGWKVSLTQEGTNAESPQPICIKQNSEGLPTPLATKLRTLTTANDKQTAALHQADGYATADEAQQVFDDRLTQLGTCADSPVYLQSGIDVDGIGDQAGGVVAVLQGEVAEYHSVVLARTGKVINIIDVAQTGKPVSVTGLGRAVAAVVDDGCSVAVGLCSFTPKAQLGVPPLGGDQPGFLAGADLPRITKGTGDWSGTDPVTDITVVGSQCESIDFANVDGPTSRKARTYLLRNDDSAPTNFGIDEVRFTMSTPAEASDLVDKISGSVAKCPDRALTAKVKELPKIDGAGAGKSVVKGRSFLVTQKTQGGDVLFRIAMISVGNKFAYLVLPTDSKFDFTNEQWTAVALRAGQRMSQVR